MYVKKQNSLSFLILLTAVFLTSFQGHASADLWLSNLRTEMLTDPEGIDTPYPRLSWEMSGDQRNIQQTAYQVLVASTPEKLAADEGDLWNSGKVSSDQSIQVAYGGVPLKSRTRCFWKVKIWTHQGESAWAAPASWSMGLLHYKDWNGRWIGLDRAFPWDSEGKFSRLSARYFRKEFEAPRQVQHATIYIMGLGLYELYINEQRIGDQVLAPVPTDYTKSVKYNTFDVTDNLRKGANAIAAVLGNGRYYTMRQAYKPYKIKTFGYPKMLLQLEIEYTDGTRQVIETDDTWKVTPDGPIRSNNEYDGETYDARKEMSGWNKAGFDDSQWLQGEYVQEPRGKFEAQMNENMAVMDTLQPVSVTKISAGTYVMDMGQNMAGWVQMRAKGSKGDSVTLRFAESLKDNGEIYTANLRDAKATDVYILKGNGEEMWQPAFVYHGFRYVEITGYSGIPTVDDFEGKVIYDRMKTTGAFETSNQTLNQIYHNAYWGIRSNYKGMPVDCPQRNERQPWLGDRATGSYGESFIFDNERLYVKWLDDIQASQKWDGSIPDVAPAFWRYYSDDMTWPGTYLMIANMLYNQYGDKEPIVQHYASMKKWMDYMRERYMEDYILTKDKYGDWCVPPESPELIHAKDPARQTDGEVIATTYYYHLLSLMQRFARLLDKPEDARQFVALAAKIKKAFNEKFLNPQTAQYSNNAITANLLPLSFGMVPEDACDGVFRNIVNKTQHAFNGHISTGLIGTQWLMRGLTEHGRPDLAYKIATNRDYPSWGYMAAQGATTIWELWNGDTADPSMNSRNHVMLLGDLIVWLYEDLAGIKTDPEHPGFRQITMKPVPVEGLDYVNASYHSMHGLIRSEWKKENKKFRWHITVPGNTKAVIAVPARSEKAVREGGKPVSSVPDITFLRMEEGRALYAIGSGDYDFESDI